MNYVLSDTKEQKTLLEALYPVGAIYISLNPTSPASFLGGEWCALAGNQTLWATAWDTSTTKELTTSDTKSAGLPDIKGKYTDRPLNRGSSEWEGAIYRSDASGTYYIGWEAYDNERAYLNFLASKGELHNGSYSNIVYGKSDTVQPPAQCVYMWRRSA